MKMYYFFTGLIVIINLAILGFIVGVIIKVLQHSGII